jgi:hypothetical protein
LFALQEPGAPSTREFQLAVDIHGEKLAQVTALFHRTIRAHRLLRPLLGSVASAPTTYPPIDHVGMAGQFSLAQVLGMSVRTTEQASRDMTVRLVDCPLQPGNDQGKPYRKYHLAIRIGDQEVVTFCTRFSDAHDDHKALMRDQQVKPHIQGIQFPARKADAMRDMTYNESNVARRAEELQDYYQQLLRQSALLTITEDFDTSPLRIQEWKSRSLRSYTKVRKDPALVHRAMLFLRLTGKVLYHQMEHTPGGQADLLQGGAPSSEQRVFLQPQWLVDVMKALVHHDLQCRLDDVDAASEANGANVKLLGAQFLHTGTLDRRLLVSGYFLP